MGEPLSFYCKTRYSFAFVGIADETDPQLAIHLAQKVLSLNVDANGVNWS
jgi:hypothetical protein